MASLVLGLAGQAAGQAIFGSTAFTLLGASISGAALGGALGGAIGSYIDNSFLLGGGAISREGPRLKDIDLPASQEGAPIPRVFGRARLAGQIIWASRFLETVTTASTRVGGKGGGGRKVTETTYAYSLSLAVGLCEGPIAGIGRIWADGRLLDSSDMTIRVHLGTEDQEPDSAIVAVEGTNDVPAYKGLAYAVFEDLDLAQFGNRVPLFQFEVFRPLGDLETSALERAVRAVVLTPGSGEFLYATMPVFRDLGGGRSAPENVNSSAGRADVLVSLDQLEQLLPNLKTVALVVAWYGDDLRSGSVAIKPGVEFTEKSTYPESWSVDGVVRGAAHLLSRDTAGRPNYGGTPSDASVVQLIRELTGRGIEVLLYPFILLDLPPGNGRSNPYDPGTAEQPAFPWRGRITCDPAPGVSGTPDKTTAATAQVASFFGGAAASQFTADAAALTVAYNGPAGDWGYRRFILHYAHLAALAGGVKGFLIGSELRGLTTIRSGVSTYPAVSELKSLAAAARGVLGASVKMTYAADWSEYFGHQPADGSGDLHFHLDDLWTDANIDAIGIDYYAPMSDWRDGANHLDALAGAANIHDRAYLQSNIEGGEGFDWYYASLAARASQTRTPITDGAYGKPWVFRYKDLTSWWENAHYHRPGGIEAASPTAYVPRAKPIWLTEIGCPAIDKGTNEPNVFFDAKSSESRVPHFSKGTRDDLIQRSAIEALLAYWEPAAGHNPYSELYAGRMIDPDRMLVWTFDARPFPDFPAREAVWSDAPNWRLGHWLNGRLGTVPLSLLVPALAGEANAGIVDAAGLSGLVTGYVIDRPMSARAAIEPLALAFAFDALEADGKIRFRDAFGAAPVLVAEEALVRRLGGEPPFEITRRQESELAAAARVTYAELGSDYRLAAVEARKLSGRSDRVSDTALPIVMEQGEAQRIADRLLHTDWAGRERARFILPPSRLAFEPGDLIDLAGPSRTHRLRITRINDGEDREIEAAGADPELLDAPLGPPRLLSPPDVQSFGRAELLFLDVPRLPGSAAEEAGYLAVNAAPWPGRIALYKGPSAEGVTLHRLLAQPAIIGQLAEPFFAGPLYRWDEGNALYVSLFSGGLVSRMRADVLNGAQLCAVRNAQGGWEVLQFSSAELLATDKYKLTGLLRGQLGTGGEMRMPVAAGASFAFLDGAIEGAGLADAEWRLPLAYRYGPSQRPITDQSYRVATYAFAGIARRPHAPVHLHGKRLASGAIEIRFIRQTREGGDDWTLAEVPLGEASEAYEVDIWSGATVVRTLAAASPLVTYDSAEQAVDFGGPAPSALTIDVYQIGASFGRGAPARAVLTV